MEESGGLERALVDLEILVAAFPDEVTIIEASSSSLSPRFVLSLNSSDDSTKQYWANITMELPANGYPNESPLRVLSYRGSPACPKHVLEKIVCVIREVANQSYVHGEDAAIPCCSIATNTWVEAIESIDVLERQQTASEESEYKRLAQELALQWQDITWISGEYVIDRKSIFQAHGTQVQSDDMVHRALEKLKTNSKIARATHNMVKYAYRFTQVNPDNTSILKHDNDDDGEDSAGRKLAHLLELKKEDGVLIVVTRWYGGIQLGAKRFHHIVNSAREVLECCHQQGLLMKK